MSVPNLISYNATVNSIVQTKKRVVYLRPQNKSDFTSSGDQLVYSLPKDGHINLLSSYLTFNITNATASTRSMMWDSSTGFNSFFDRVSIQDGNGWTFKEINAYDVLQGIKGVIVDQNEQNYRVSALGNNTQLFQIPSGTIEAATGRKLMGTVALSDIFEQMPVLPTTHLSGEIKVVFHTNNKFACAASKGVTAEYGLNNCQLQLAYFNLPSDVDRMLYNKAWQVVFPNYSHHMTTITLGATNSTTSTSFSLRPSQKSVRALYCVFRNQSSINTSDRNSHNFELPNIFSLQASIGGENVPQNAITTSEELLTNLLEVSNRKIAYKNDESLVSAAPITAVYHASDPSLNATYSDKKIVFALDLRSISEHQQTNSQLSGMDISGKEVSINMSFTVNTNWANKVLQMDCFLEYETVMSVDENGVSSYFS